MKPTIAEVLHYAADHCLSKNRYSTSKSEVESCNAVYMACEKLGADSIQIDSIFKGFRRMGLNTSGFNFKTFKCGHHRQGARYAWLKFAALIAEEQGV